MNATFEDSVLNMNAKDQEFGLNLAQHFRFAFYESGDDFLYDMVTALRYLNTSANTVAYTDKEKYIYLNAPQGGGVGKNMIGWKFIYIHECLHQLWDTFGVEDVITQEDGSCNHTVMNVASDCIINDFVHRFYNLDYPTDGLITPELITDEFKIEFNPKKDNQYSLYKKLIPFAKNIEKNSKFKKAMDENAPNINIPSQKSSQGSTDLIPTSQQYKNGHEKAIYLINRILKNCYDKYNANNGDLNNVVTALNAALKQIMILGGQGRKYVYESTTLLDYKEFTKLFEAIDPKYQTFEQGFDAAINEATKQIENVIMQIANFQNNNNTDEDIKTQPPTKNQMPDFNETEEELYLPKSLSKDLNMNQNDDNDSEQDNKNGKGDKENKDKKEGKGGQGNKQGKDTKNGKDKEQRVDGVAEMPKDNKLGNDPAKGKNTPKQNKPNPKGNKNAFSHGDEFSGKLHDFQEDLQERERLPKAIVDAYKRESSGAIGEFVKICRMAKTEGYGLAAKNENGEDRKKWGAKFITSAMNIMRSGIARIEREFRKTYSRPNRRSGIIEPGQVIKKGEMEIINGTTITMKFFIDISGSMGDNKVRRCFTAVYTVCEQVLKITKNSQRIEKVDCLVHPFTEEIQDAVKIGTIPRSTGGNCKFPELLDYMSKYNENTLISVIITDAQWDIVKGSASKAIRSMPGMIIFITNNTSESQIEDLKEIEKACNNFKLILADEDFTLKS